MSAALEIPDTGTISVKVGAATVSLDAYETYNQILDLHTKCDDEDKPIHEFHTAVVDLLEKKGLPRLSHYQADRFCSKLFEAVRELGKAPDTAPTPDSQPSTAPVS